MFFGSEKKLRIPTPEQALPGRDAKIPVAERHFVLGTPLQGPFPDDTKMAMFGLGCFWGAERKFWTLAGVWTTAVGYSGGFTPNPTYEEVCGGLTGHAEVVGVFTTAVGYAAGLTPNPTYQEVCSGLTGHNEVVLVVYRPAELSYDEVLQLFWESHDPTQGMKQGNDRGTQYRSGAYYFDDEQRQLATESMQRYQHALSDAGYDRSTTEIIAAPTFYYAEDYHQQYLATNPAGYCGLGGTGVGCPGNLV